MAVDDAAARRAPQVALVIEPTPFTHISGYANRFKEMLKFMKKADVQVEVRAAALLAARALSLRPPRDARPLRSRQIITPDDSEDAPAEYMGYNITTISGFRFPLYKQICLSAALAPRGGWRSWGRRLLMDTNAWNEASLAKRVLADTKPDLVHITSPGFVMLGLLKFVQEDLDVPLVFSYHTHLPLYGRNYMGWLPGVEEICWWALRSTHNRADLTLVTSPPMKAEFEEHGIERVEVWNKGIDTVVFHPKYGAKPWFLEARKTAARDAAKADGVGDADATLAAADAAAREMRERLTGGQPDAPLVIYVGRLGAEKRLRDLKDMLARLPDARLALVGDGPDRAALEAHFEGTSTVFTGLLRGEELSRAFAAADVFAMPSDSETLGFVVLEAMASGVPVVGCDAGGVPSLIADGETGFLFAPGDTAALAEKVGALISDRALVEKVGKAARAEAEKWGWEAATANLRTTQYKMAVENHRKRTALENKRAEPVMVSFSTRVLGVLWQLNRRFKFARAQLKQIFTAPLRILAKPLQMLRGPKAA